VFRRFERATKRNRFIETPAAWLHAASESVWLALVWGVAVFIAALSEPLEWDSSVWVTGLIVAAACEVPRVLGRISKRHDRTLALRSKMQAFLNEIFSVFLRNYGDFRVTLLLPWSDSQGHDYLKAALRANGASTEGRPLRVNETKRHVQGVAGQAWLRGSPVSASYVSPYAACVTNSDRASYRNAMHVDEEFCNDLRGRNPRYVLAIPLQVGGERAGVLCIDARESSNVLGLAAPLDQGASAEEGERALAEASTIEKLIQASCQRLERLLAQVYEECGDNNVDQH